MLEPMTFPTAISVSPLRAAAILVTSSGREVPIATIVRPIRVWLTPKEAAISLALFTTSCPPPITAASPMTAKIIPFKSGGRSSSEEISSVTDSRFPLRIVESRNQTKTASRMIPSILER